MRTGQRAHQKGITMKLFQFKRRQHSLRGQKNSHFVKKFVVFLLILSCVIGFFVFIPSLIKSPVIVITTDNVNCTDVEDLSNEIIKKNLSFFTFNKKQLEIDLKKQYFCIQYVGIRRSPLYKIYIHINGRQPVLRVQSMTVLNIPTPTSTISAHIVRMAEFDATGSMQIASGSPGLIVPIFQKGTETFLVDSEGALFAIDNSINDIPILYYANKSLHIGLLLDNNLVTNIHDIYDKLRLFGINLTELELTSPKMLVLYTNPKIIFDPQQDLKSQVGALQLILEKAKINEEKIEFIDLRFDKPIIRYLNKKGEK